MKQHRPYELQEYDPKWKDVFSNTAEELKSLLGSNLVEIDHIGSTSIPGMVAKPQVDILAVVKNLSEVQQLRTDFEKASFTYHGRGYVAEDDEYVSKDTTGGKRIASVHILEEGNPKIEEYKVFRDYLKSHEEDRNLYIATKRNLFSSHKENYSGYDTGKKEVVNQIKARAREWAAGPIK